MNVISAPVGVRQELEWQATLIDLPVTSLRGQHFFLVGEVPRRGTRASFEEPQSGLAAELCVKTSTSFEKHSASE